MKEQIINDYLKKQVKNDGHHRLRMRFSHLSHFVYFVKYGIKGVIRPLPGKCLKWFDK